MHKIVKVEALDGYRLSIVFDDGVTGTVDLSDRLFGPVFEPLREVAYFRQVSIDEFGAVSWPNGADLAPDALHARLKNRTTAVA
ncbi:MAG: DUF2442 domain-containing protein [Betaproteobacteria bacterium]|nr:DUF2442 domain-containing protein [Betaproteobacteria bacterium]